MKKMKLLIQVIQNKVEAKEKQMMLKNELADFQKVLPELSVMANGLILKGDRIVLPESLQSRALQLAHRGVHPGQGGMERWVRSHFYVQKLTEKVTERFGSCKDCQIYTRKYTKEPI